MTTSITTLAAAEHTADLRRFADHQRLIAAARERRVPEAADVPSVSLRIANGADAQAARDLAALDDAPVLDGEVLLALIDGEAVAALSLHDGRVVANPFVRTAAAVTLLRLRAKQFAGKGRRRGRPFVTRPRFA
jgi:hypothetical protein